MAAVCICFSHLFWRRCEEELATGQGQLPHVAVREGEAALRREEISVDQEKQRSARMVSVGEEEASPEPDRSPAQLLLC